MESPYKKPKTSEKLPATLLHEYCDQRKYSLPYYEDLGGQISDGIKVFCCRISLNNMTTEGTGLSKKSAKHSAAANLLEKFGIKTNYVGDAKEEGKSKLFSLCLERNWPLPQYEEVSDPSHSYQFTYRCILSSIVKEASAPTKKQAKQKAAQMVLQVVQEMNLKEPEKLKLLEIRDVLSDEMEDDNMVIKYYLEYKKSTIKKQVGVKFSDRHNFFVSLDQEKVQQAKRFLTDDSLSYQNRISKMCHTLELKYKIEQVPSLHTPLMAFDLDNENYDCYFIAFADDFWKKLYEYFQVMLSTKII